MAEEIREFSRQMLWPCPTPITLQPVSAPVVLIHWRPFAFLWNQLSREEREELKHLGSFGSPLPSASQPAGRRRHRQGGRRTRSGQAPTPRGATASNRTPGKGRAANFTAPPRQTPTAKTQADGASGHAPGTRGAGRTTKTQTATSQQAPGAIPRTRVAQASPPEAYDAHFHLDRLEQRVQARGIQARAEPGGPPRVPAAVVGGVLNYCDPERYLEIVFPTNRAWKVAVGIHPKHAPRVDDRMLDQLEALVCDTRVAGISELSLDHSTPPATWGLQERLLDRILRMGVSGRVLVIHAGRATGVGIPTGRQFIAESANSSCADALGTSVCRCIVQAHRWRRSGHGEGCFRTPTSVSAGEWFLSRPNSRRHSGPSRATASCWRRTPRNPPDPSLPWGSSGTCGPDPP